MNEISLNCLVIKRFFCITLNRYDSHSKGVNIVLVGKYTKLEDAYTSVIKSLKHASLMCRHRLTLCCVEADDLENETLEKDPSKYFEAWKSLSQANGVIVPGGFGTRGTEGKVAAAKYARERKLPYLGEYDYITVTRYSSFFEIKYSLLCCESPSQVCVWECRSQ